MITTEKETEREERERAEGGVGVRLTQMVPVSIPTESLLVSGLKDIQVL